jgi:uncharacterized damage-inducible protein DinB
MLSFVPIPREMLRDLLRHMEWADARVWASMPPDMNDGRVRALLAHIHTVQHAFLTIWTGSEDLHVVLKQSDTLASMEALREWGRAYYSRAHALLASATDADLDRIVEMPWAAQIADYLGHPPGATTMAETVLQVTSHSTYHRGQVNARLRELGVSPPVVDYIAWLWGRRPDPA